MNASLQRLVAPAAARGCVDLPAVQKVAESSPGEGPLREFLKAELARADNRLAGQFWKGHDVAELVRARAWAVEQLVLLAWQQCVLNKVGNDLAEPCLVAVGGFGRGELHPHSDVDLLVLVEGIGVGAAQAKTDAMQGPEVCNGEVKSSRVSSRDSSATAYAAPAEAIEAFVRLLWDSGLYLGHSVRTVDDCVDEASADVATATSLMESRLLSGPHALYARLCEAVSADRIWDGRTFFSAKCEEQQARHARFNDTAYNLEPNIKEGPGGLRDIQTIGWVAKRHFSAQTLHGLVEHGFLTESEHADLVAGQRLLWRVRYALHLLAGRGEDRLLFDFQRDMARRFGYEDSDANLAVEQFMQSYYRTVMRLERLNESLLQLFEEELLHTAADQPVDLGGGFSEMHGFISIDDPATLIRRPACLMELFLRLAREPALRGVGAQTVRMIRDHLYLIDEQFREDPEVNRLFLDLLSQPQGVYTQLSRMNRYGVLAAYLPVFGLIVGRMQYDLFHVYTVDQHTLFVIRNLRRFAYGKYSETFPHVQSVFRRIEQPAVLYLAALFHDIAKGRGGDHSELGAEDARLFCARLDMDAEDRELVSWLVENHLLMSRTAQRKDLSDPDTIHGFAAVTRSMRRLDHLYLLTVADIAGTSPKLWNTWKNSLLWDLYLSTGHALRRGLENPVERETRIRERRSGTLSRLLRKGHSARAIQAIWDTLPEHAFLRLSARQLEWATEAVLENPPRSDVIAVRDVQPHGVSEVLVCVPDRTGLFASITNVFDEMGMNVLSARVLTTDDRRSFDLFQIMDRNDGVLSGVEAEDLRQRLLRAAPGDGELRPVRRMTPRKLRHFSAAPKIRFTDEPSGRGTLMELECADRPGLLSRVASVLSHAGVQVHDARIATFGERVEDTFVLSGRKHAPLTQGVCQQLEKQIAARLAAE